MLYCCGCEREVDARLTNGKEIYPLRQDLWLLPFWRCDECGNYVGCHNKTNHPTRPLGVIPTQELRKARMSVHAAIDPIWKGGSMTRKELYAEMGRRLGLSGSYHTAETRTVKECENALMEAKQMAGRSR